MDRLKGKVAIVTGAASGIGRASAKLFAAEGAAVVAVDRAEAVHETAKAIVDAGGRAKAITADASKEDDVAGFVDAAVKDYGRLDAIYANAGISGGGQPPFFELTAEHWRQVLDVNLIGVFLAIKHASRVMVPFSVSATISSPSLIRPDIASHFLADAFSPIDSKTCSSLVTWFSVSARWFWIAVRSSSVVAALAILGSALVRCCSAQ